jgi:endonuclease YncB( thermonuclease family)
MTKFYLIVFTFILFGCNHPESSNYKRFKEVDFKEEKESASIAETFRYKVIGIKDGDTFVVLINGQRQVIRLEHIDCPEKKQPFGTKAKQFASDLCLGKYVRLNHKNKYDRSKRLLAEIILPSGVNVNKELVSNGLAWHFKKYSDSQEYAELEEKAQKNKSNIWGESNPTAPWNWRKK